MADTVLLLRTCDADGTSYGGYRWPLEVGAVAEAPDWDPSPICGGGLHGLLWGHGDGSLLDWSETARWLVVAADAAEVVDIRGGKVKCRRATIRHVGDRMSATRYMAEHAPPGTTIVGDTVTAGDYGLPRHRDGGRRRRRGDPGRRALRRRARRRRRNR